MEKVTKTDMYINLSERYGFTPTYIADMNPYLQLDYYRGPKVVEMSHAEFQQFQRSLKK